MQEFSGNPDINQGEVRSGAGVFNTWIKVLDNLFSRNFCGCDHSK